MKQINNKIKNLKNKKGRNQINKATKEVLIKKIRKNKINKNNKKIGGCWEGPKMVRQYNQKQLKRWREE